MCGSRAPPGRCSSSAAARWWRSPAPADASRKRVSPSAARSTPRSPPSPSASPISARRTESRSTASIRAWSRPSGNGGAFAPKSNARASPRRRSANGSAAKPASPATAITRSYCPCRQELEVQYRWHPYFGRKVVIRRVTQRATGRFLSILGPAGVVVVTIADWMLDPIVCAALPEGNPRVDLAALLELKRLLMCAADTTHSWGDSEILQEDHHDALKLPSPIAGRQMNLLFEAKRSEGLSPA